MKNFLQLISILSGILLLLSCSVEHTYTKERTEAGNDLTFVHFKTLSANNDSYIQVFTDVYEIDTSRMQMSYWGGQYEVTNKQYWNFLFSLRDQDSLSLFEKHQPKTELWKKDDSFEMGDSLSIYYDSLELFGNYPVVNISIADAQAYVNWLNQIEPDSLVYYRLFNTFEWLELFNDHPNLDSSFAWGGNYWRNESHAPLGNYAEFNQDQIRYNQRTDDVYWENTDSTGYTTFVNGPMEVYSYLPNNWGAYNMSGNVAEIVFSYFELDGISYCQTYGGSWHSPVFYLRKLARETYELPSPYVGIRVLKTRLIPKQL